MAVKKTPIGVIPYILSSFLSSKRSPRGGSGPPLPLNPVVRRVLSYVPTFGRQRFPRTRSAVCAAHPDIRRPGVKFCVSDFRQSQEWRWKTGRILAWIP